MDDEKCGLCRKRRDNLQKPEQRDVLTYFRLFHPFSLDAKFCGVCLELGKNASEQNYYGVRSNPFGAPRRFQNRQKYSDDDLLTFGSSNNNVYYTQNRIRTDSEVLMSSPQLLSIYRRIQPQSHVPRPTVSDDDDDDEDGENEPMSKRARPMPLSKKLEREHEQAWQKKISKPMPKSRKDQLIKGRNTRMSQQKRSRRNSGEGSPGQSGPAAGPSSRRPAISPEMPTVFDVDDNEISPPMLEITPREIPTARTKKLQEKTAKPNQPKSKLEQFETHKKHMRQQKLSFNIPTAVLAQSTKAGPSTRPNEAGPSIRSNEAGPSSRSTEAGPSSRSNEAGPSNQITEVLGFEDFPVHRNVTGG